MWWHGAHGRTAADLERDFPAAVRRARALPQLLALRAAAVGRRGRAAAGDVLRVGVVALALAVAPVRRSSRQPPPAPAARLDRQAGRAKAALDSRAAARAGGAGSVPARRARGGRSLQLGGVAVLVPERLRVVLLGRRPEAEAEAAAVLVAPRGRRGRGAHRAAGKLSADSGSGAEMCLTAAGTLKNVPPRRSPRTEVGRRVPPEASMPPGKAGPNVKIHDCAVSAVSLGTTAQIEDLIGSTCEYVVLSRKVAGFAARRVDDVVSRVSGADGETVGTCRPRNSVAFSSSPFRPRLHKAAGGGVDVCTRIIHTYVKLLIDAYGC